MRCRVLCFLDPVGDSEFPISQAFSNREVFATYFCDDFLASFPERTPVNPCNIHSLTYFWFLFHVFICFSDTSTLIHASIPTRRFSLRKQVDDQSLRLGESMVSDILLSALPTEANMAPIPAKKIAKSHIGMAHRPMTPPRITSAQPRMLFTPPPSLPVPSDLQPPCPRLLPPPSPRRGRHRASA